MTPPRRVSDYQRMSRAQKVSYYLTRMRRVELTRCPACNTMVLVRQLDAHVRERCPGPPSGLVSPDGVAYCG